MSTYGELKEAIRRALVRNDELTTDNNSALDDSTVEYYIKRAIDYYKVENLFFNNKTLEDSSTTLVSQQEYLDFPSDFIEPVLWRITQSGYEDLIVKTLYSDVESYRSTDSGNYFASPDMYAIRNGRFEIYPTPNQPLTSRITYVYDLGALVNDSDSNGWTTEAENMIRNKAMEYIYRERLHDDTRANSFASQAKEEFKKLRNRTNDQQKSGFVRVDPFMSLTRY